MSVEPDQLIIKGGEMGVASTAANIDLVRRELDRPGLCVMVLVDHDHPVAGDRIVPHNQVCLTTTGLLEEADLPSQLAATNDLGNRYQFTLWLPDEPTDTLITRLWAAFRGPFPKNEVSDAWTADDLRGLRHPGS